MIIMSGSIHLLRDLNLLGMVCCEAYVEQMLECHLTVNNVAHYIYI